MWAKILNLAKMNEMFSPTDQKAGIRSNLHFLESVPSHEAGSIDSLLFSLKSEIRFL